MKYDRMELQEFKSDKPIVFDPPKQMFVCDAAELLLCNGNIDYVYAYIPAAEYPVKTSRNCYSRCAEIPEELKPRRATNRELAKWLAQGNGEWKWGGSNSCFTNGYYYSCTSDDANRPVSDDILVRKWDDTQWHEPTVDYLFGEDAE